MTRKVVALGNDIANGTLRGRLRVAEDPRLRVDEGRGDDDEE